VVEDAAQHWLSHNCDRVGTSAISFDPTKNLCSYGNGGAVLTDDSNLAEFARHWRDNAKPAHDLIGTNSRMSEVDCAQMLVKTKHLDRWQKRRHDIAAYWIERFKDVSGLRTLITTNTLRDHGLQKFVLDIDHRDAIVEHLTLRKIETKIHYRYPLHETGIYTTHCGGPDFFAAASSLARRCVSLPFYPELTDLQVEYIADQVISLVISHAA
jgi:dTDP-4-amino-4,6-dideoxygalactose transaminase